MNYATIKYCDIANGTGVRTSLFVSGCTHHCEGCFNEVAWDFEYGNPFTGKVEDEIIKSMEPEYVSGLTLLGGEPLEPVNQRALLPFLKKVKTVYPGKDIWCYTGYTYETDLLTGRAHCEVTDELLTLIDVLVDGEFIQAKKNISLQFRGSENQRILRLHKNNLA